MKALSAVCLVCALCVLGGPLASTTHVVAEDPSAVQPTLAEPPATIAVLSAPAVPPPALSVSPSPPPAMEPAAVPVAFPPQEVLSGPVVPATPTDALANPPAIPHVWRTTSGPTPPSEPKPAPPRLGLSGRAQQVCVTLADGKSLRGGLPAEALPLKTTFGELKIPTSLIGRIDWVQPTKSASAVVVFRNGDRLTGEMALSKIMLNTSWGEAMIDQAQVAGISMDGAAQPAAYYAPTPATRPSPPSYSPGAPRYTPGPQPYQGPNSPAQPPAYPAPPSIVPPPQPNQPSPRPTYTPPIHPVSPTPEVLEPPSAEANSSSSASESPAENAPPTLVVPEAVTPLPASEREDPPVG